MSINTRDGRRRIVSKALIAMVAAGVAVGCTSHTGTTGSQWPTVRVSQTYWYCWNVGPALPHHYGHHVVGDHLCTDAELGR
jgi:hypothetical protein